MSYAQQGLSSIVTNASIRMPTLVRRYVDAHARLGISVWVAQGDYGKFEGRAKKLRDSGILPSDYATYVVTRYIDYCKSKGMIRVPLNMFLGDAAMDEYLKYVAQTGSKRVDVDKQHELFYSEAAVAEAYISSTIAGKSFTLDDIVNTLRPILAEDYFILNSIERASLRSTVIQHLRVVYKLNGIRLESYDDVAYAIMQKEHADAE